MTIDNLSSLLIPSSRPNSYRRGLRVARFYNETNDTIPSFALMQLKRPKNRSRSFGSYDENAEEDEFFCQEQRNEDIVWSVSMCDDEAAARQNPAQFAFNLEKPIPRRQTGEGTFDMPAQVLHNGDSDSLPNWRACGPIPGKWWVGSGGSAFTCVSHDACQAAGRGVVHTVWVRANARQAAAHFRAFSFPGVSVESGSYVTLFTSGEASRFNINLESPWAVVQRSGMYTFGLQCKLSSTTAPRGASLLLQVYRRDGETGEISTTMWSGERDQDIEEDQYGGQILHAAENVAVTGWENLAKDDALAVRNLSSHTVGLTRFQFWMMQTAHYREEASSQSGSLSFDRA